MVDEEHGTGKRESHNDQAHRHNWYLKWLSWEAVKLVMSEVSQVLSSTYFGRRTRGRVRRSGGYYFCQPGKVTVTVEMIVRDVKID